MKDRICLILMLCVFLSVPFATASAQPAGSTVKIVGVKFAGGKRQVTMRGVASGLVTYVYKLNVRRGQTVAVKLDSSEPELTFSVFSGKNERLGFRVRDWSDNAYASGTYSIVLVLGGEEAALARRLRYERELRKKFDDEEIRRLKIRLRDADLEARGGGGETLRELNRQFDETAVREFNQGMEQFKLQRQIDELEAIIKEKKAKIPYSLLVKVE